MRISVSFRSYFSRVTRERRKFGNESQASAIISDVTSSQVQDNQQEDNEDESDFDAAVSTSETYELLDIAIDTLDDILSEQ